MLHSRHVLRADARTSGAGGVPGPAEAQIAFTDRRGGYSSGHYGSFNLAHHVGDDAMAVDGNRALLASAIDLEASALVFVNQVHGAAVAEVTADSRPGPNVEADALVTREAGLALAMMVADCTPVMIADPAAGVIGAVHAGRPGMMAGVVGAAVAAMRDLGARELHAVVGPSVCSRCYEVPAELREEAARVSPVAAAVSHTGTPAIDVAGAVVESLHALGATVTWEQSCTRQTPELYSYRRDGTTGRFAGVIWRRNTPRDLRRDPVHLR